MSEIRANTVSDAAGTGPVTLTGQSAAKAWSSVNLTSFSLLESFNVSSATDGGAGRATINLTNAMSSADYAVSVGGYIEAFAQHFAGWSAGAVSYNTWASNGSSAYSDTREISGVAMGDLA